MPSEYDRILEKLEGYRPDGNSHLQVGTVREMIATITRLREDVATATKLVVQYDEQAERSRTLANEHCALIADQAAELTRLREEVAELRADHTRFNKALEVDPEYFSLVFPDGPPKRKMSVGKHAALNYQTIRRALALAERLDPFLADVIMWAVWWQCLDNNRQEELSKMVFEQAATLAEALEVIEPFAALSERNDKDAEDYGYSLLDDDRPQYFVWHPAEDGKPQRLNMGHLRHAADFNKKHGG